MSLTRPQFDHACQDYIHKHSTGDDSGEASARYPSGWSWNEHKVRRALSCLISSELDYRRSLAWATFRVSSGIPSPPDKTLVVMQVKMLRSLC